MMPHENGVDDVLYNQTAEYVSVHCCVIFIPILPKDMSDDYGSCLEYYDLRLYQKRGWRRAFARLMMWCQTSGIFLAQ